MRHSYNKLKKLHGTSQKSNNIVRNLITSLIISGQIVTTPRKAKILVSSFDKFVSKLVSLKNKYESEQDVKREAIRIVKSVVYSEDAGKKMIEDLFTKYIQLQKNSGYVQNYKLGQRPGDNAEKILVKII